MDLQLIRGDTYLLTFSLQDKNGNAYALTDKDKCYFTVKKDFYRAECVLQKQYGDGITYNTETGLYEIRLTQVCTCDLACGNYVYDIKVKIADGERELVKTLVKGNLSIVSNATHKVNEQ